MSLVLIPGSSSFPRSDCVIFPVLLPASLIENQKGFQISEMLCSH